MEFLTTHPAITWATVGVALLIVEVLLANGFFLSFAVASFVVALATWIGIAPDSILWNVVMMLALGLVLVPVLRSALRRYADRTPDINKY
jgi:membrane protein implicated in regulation of membrane protease activity